MKLSLWNSSQQFCNYSKQFCLCKLQSSDTISVISQQLQHNLVALFKHLHSLQSSVLNEPSLRSVFKENPIRSRRALLICFVTATLAAQSRLKTTRIEKTSSNSVEGVTHTAQFAVCVTADAYIFILFTLFNYLLPVWGNVPSQCICQILWLQWCHQISWSQVICSLSPRPRCTLWPKKTLQWPISEAYETCVFVWGACVLAFEGRIGRGSC